MVVTTDSPINYISRLCDAGGAQLGSTQSDGDLLIKRG